MTKKHFIALADAIREYQTQSSCGKKLRFNGDHIEALASYCASQNERFNKARWIDYINGKCGKNGGKVKQAV